MVRLAPGLPVWRHRPCGRSAFRRSRSTGPAGRISKRSSSRSCSARPFAPPGRRAALGARHRLLAPAAAGSRRGAARRLGQRPGRCGRAGPAPGHRRRSSRSRSARATALCRFARPAARMAVLVACGNAICGNSAIAAVAPVIGASRRTWRRPSPSRRFSAWSSCSACRCSSRSLACRDAVRRARRPDGLRGAAGAGGDVSGRRARQQMARWSSSCAC